MSEPEPPSPNRSTLFAVLAVAIAGATATGAWFVVSGYQAALEAAKRPADVEEVVAAAHDLAAGAVLADADLISIRVPRPTLTADPYVLKRDELIGETVHERMFAGEPIRRERLADGTSLDDTMLEPGTRAVTVKVDRAAGVGGLVQPGAYVDVVVTIRPDENALDAKWVTETIIQAVRVLAVGDSTVATTRDEARAQAGPLKAREAPATRSREVYATLEVEPDEVEKIAMATSRGDVYLSLRARNDFDLVANDKPLVTNALVGIDGKPSPARADRLARRRAELAPVAAPTPAPASTQAEVISGSTTTLQQFDAEGKRIVEPKKGK